MLRVYRILPKDTKSLTTRDTAYEGEDPSRNPILGPQRLDSDLIKHGSVRQQLHKHGIRPIYRYRGNPKPQHPNAPLVYDVPA